MFSHSHLKLSVVVTCHDCKLETEGLLTQGSFGESVSGISEMVSSDWSNGIRYYMFGTKPDTEFNYL